MDGRVPYWPPGHGGSEQDASLVGNPGRMRAIMKEDHNSNHIGTGGDGRHLEPGSQAGMALPKGGYVPGMRVVHFDIKASLSFVHPMISLIKF